METLSSLCDTCQTIKFNDAAAGGHASQDEAGNRILKFEDYDFSFDTGLSIRDSFPHFPFLVNSIERNDCDCCRLLKSSILKGILTLGYNDMKELQCELSAEYYWHFYNSEVLQALRLKITLSDDQDSYIDSTYVTHFVQSSSQNPVQTWLRHRVVDSTQLLTPANVDWIQSQLTSCPECERLPRTGLLPTRLVKVSHDPPHLVHMDEETIQCYGRNAITYAALSYCWGPSAQQLTTKQNTIKDRCAAILDTQMTPSLRDAIAVCRALSIHFLWVDALCIIQDSTDDWEREFTQIGRIFSDADVTICAWASESCLESFVSRPKGLVIPFQSFIDRNIYGTYYLTAGVDADIGEFIDMDWISSAWKTRAWTLQEEHMSTKILAFGISGLHFICAHRHQTQGQACRDERFTGFHHDVAQKSTSDKYMAWHSLVTLYSSRFLTYSTDRLLAISVIAGAFQSILNDDYVVGLWRRELHKGLFWSLGSCSERPVRWEDILSWIMGAEEYIAPSWSWASRPRKIEFGNGKLCPYFDRVPRLWMKQYHAITPLIKLEGSDPHGRVSSASLQITTRVYKIQAEIVIYDLDRRYVEIMGYSGIYTKPLFRCTLDWGLTADGQRLTKVAPEHLSLVLLGSIRKDGEDSRGDEDKESTQWNPYREDDPDDDEVAYGLLIYQLPNTANFVRVGLFHSRASDGWGLRLFEDHEMVTVNLV